MTDYGHELLFGTFTTPVADPPMQPVELSILAEQAGLDFVTFQDHPYQVAFHDTLTLMTYIAAKTERIRITANVHNLPLRHPSMLAKAAATIDRLSGGRFELGIGAGGFWPAIAGMGGPRRTPGESVEALEEGIEIIRQFWDTDERGGVRVEGKYYQVKGAKRGPKPAHDIGIWVGAYGPRMLRLTGRLGDGWLPSLPYLKGGPSDLADMNRHIDTGAEQSGRDPSAIRRMLNLGGQFSPTRNGFLDGPPEAWAEDLASLTLDYGISGFFLMGDDPQIIELLGTEIAPATREIVASQRTATAR